MSKKSYSTPTVKSENVVLGVFGCYGTTNAGTNYASLFGNWGWIFRFFGRRRRRG